MNAIVNVDENWGIGRDGDLIFPIPEDMQFFKKMTTGKIVVMGRRTLASFPGGRALKDRTNIVLTRKQNTPIQNAIVCHNLGQLQATLQPHPPQDVFVIGGEAIYRQLIDSCAIAYVTKVQSSAVADNHFPNLDGRPGWILAEESEPHHYNGLTFTFCTYQNQQVQPIAAE
ncbi:dihydrofolate reductase [Ruminococcaceae bacterium OttesenSCG-928-A16]|nr:dihydrofolate reductase [Ruminococcaceae bacterium OttesenSCG-928-A16]